MIYGQDDFWTPLDYQYNTGIIVCELIERAIEIIRSNPDGCALTAEAPL